MSVEDELPDLLEELANDHLVGEPGSFEPARAGWHEGDRVRSARFTVAAAAACSAMLIGGLLAIGFINDDAAPLVAPSTTSPANQPPPPEPATPVSDVVESPALDLIQIDVRSASEGTTEVALVFDGDLPQSEVVPLSDAASPPADRVSYATQTSLDTPVTVCGATHWFPSPGNRIVDVFVPSAWFGPDSAMDPPTTWAPGSGPPSKIIVCEPLNGTVQISVWGAASGRLDDVGLSIGERTITVLIDPDPANSSAESSPATTSESPAETVDDEPLPAASIDPLASPLVAITGDGDAVYFPDDGAAPVLIYDGADPDDGSALGDGPNGVDRVAYAAAEHRFVVGFCCSPVVGQVVSARPEELPMSADIAPPKDQMGEAEFVFDGYQYAPALDPDGARQVSIVGDGRGIWVIDAAIDTFANVRLPDEAGDLWDLVWNESGIVVLGRTEFTWTLTTADYSEGQIELGATRNFATFSDFENLRFAGTAVQGEIALHERGTDTVLSGTINDYGNNNGDERGSSLQVITLPAPALSAWFHDPGQLIWVDPDRTLRAGNRVVLGEYTWAGR